MKLLSSDPGLHTPDHSQTFILHISTSTNAVGAVLLQEDSNAKVLQCVFYFSAKLKLHQRGYSVTELALSLVMRLKKFDCYLHQHPHPVRVFPDHHPLLFFSTPINNLWYGLSMLQQYHLDIHHDKLAQNVITSAPWKDFNSDTRGLVKGFLPLTPMSLRRTWRAG